jgi:3-isopropylmalate dehydrogenase
MKKWKIALVLGDGSGPEMMVGACMVVEAAAKKDGLAISFEETPMGWNAYHNHGDTLPQRSLKRAMDLGVIFFGGVGDPQFDDIIGKEKPEMKPEARALLTLRKQMGLLLNFRPMVYYKALAHLSNVKPEMIPEEGVEQVFIRFLLEDSYFGTADLASNIDSDTRAALGIKLKKDVTGEEELITDLAYYRKSTIEKYIRAAFKYAKQRGFPLMSIDKANVMARYDYWRKIVTRVGKQEFPEVPLSHQYSDSAATLLFTPAELQGVIACGNEHGDILSDGAAKALGSMGLMCSSAINPDNGAAMFESGAGTAPSIAGQNKANPIGRILSGAMMLRHLGYPNGARAIESSVNRVLVEGYRTPDLFTCAAGEIRVGTREMVNAVLSYI